MADREERLATTESNPLRYCGVLQPTSGRRAGFRCTLPVGHGGEHAAWQCETSGWRLLARWAADEVEDQGVGGTDSYPEPASPAYDRDETVEWVRKFLHETPPMSDDFRSSLIELCWDCHEPLDPDAHSVRIENEWPLGGAHFYHPSCAKRVLAARTKQEERRGALLDGDTPVPPIQADPALRNESDRP